MKDISIYFAPVNEDLLPKGDDSLHNLIHIHTDAGFPDLNQRGLAILYVPENRNGIGVKGENQSFRSQFYQLNKGDAWNFSLYDLGTIQPGETVADTYFAVGQVVTELIKKEIVPIVIGGSQDLTIACYKGFEPLEQMVNVCSIDSRLDVGSPDDDVRSDGFVSHLLMQRPCYLFNYAVIGIQRPFVSKDAMSLFDRLYFDVCRLGEFNANFKIAEPHLRNSDIISLDFESIRCGETDNGIYKNPNGFYADQVCQLAKYGGISDKTACFGIFNIHPNQNTVSSDLVAQIIWYFIDGYAQRVGDFPVGSKKNYVKFHVHMDEFDDDLVFYKSDKSERWWLEVKYPSGNAGKYERHQLVPCDKADYEASMKNIIPNLWWKTIQKLS